MSSKTSEKELSEAVLVILSNKSSGEATYRELFDKIPALVTLSAEDEKQSSTRTNESMWEQRVRNITSHKDSPGNYIAKGFLEEISNGLKITPAGLKHTKSQR